MTLRFQRVPAVVFGALALSAAATATAGESSPRAAGGDAPVFETDVRPVLKANCFHCHGEEEKLKGGLDLRLVALMRRGSDSGPVVEPGDRAASPLYRMLAEGEMPPKKEQQLDAEEIELIGRWIDAGAKTIHAEPETLPEPGQFFVTPVERRHWSFQPIEKPSVPSNDHEHPVDAFLAEALAAKNLGFSESADRATLIRRASFDLLGLPPEPDDVAAFLADDEPGAWERVVDRLLASPRYGERWARHWLDVAGYSDSEGYNDKDTIRPDAWHYRDYVVRSLNEDKPWDRFLTEQLAGDELVGATHANAQGLANRDAEAREMLTATAFLRLAPDGTGSKPDDPEHAKNAVVTETVNIVSSSLFGLTVGCAECHDHRFDPIPQEDFYRMRAVFAPVYDTENWRAPNARRAALVSEEDKARADELEAEAKEATKQQIAEMERVVGIIFERELEKLPESERAFAREAYETPAGERTPEQAAFLKDEHPSVNVRRAFLHLFVNKYEDGDELKKKYEALAEKAKEIRSRKPEPDYIRVATEDTKHVPETRLFHRGDFLSPEGDPIQPAGLEVLGAPPIAADDPELPTTGRRLAYAKHLVSGEHPLVSRVLVNRFWMHHFGRGIVATPGEFGMRSTGPSHPELLDWLAADFAENGWSLKRFHRLVLTSRAWRQKSARRADGLAVDADNTLVWRMPVQRLEAETVRDAILSVSGRLKPTLYGAPVPVSENEGGLFSVGGGETSEDGQEFRRSLYVQQRRTAPVAMLQAFDAPQMEPNCERRVSSTVAVQALELMNGYFSLAESEAFAKRVLADCGEASEAGDRAARAWELAFGTKPDGRTLAELTDYLARQEAVLPPRKESKTQEAAGSDTLALASLCQVFFKTNRFLYAD
ncbi:MAG: DUF1553 domain-containing protein [Verrucomicrobiales bacterium]